jgi:hypothetical protein
MSVHRWPPALERDELGVIAHGPVILARASGIVAGLRCVFAYPQGIELDFVLRASGVQADVASHQVRDTAGAQVHVRVDQREGLACPTGGPITSGNGRFAWHTRYWIDQIPSDGLVHIRVAWPQAGLPETESTLTLNDLRGLDTRVLSLT